MKFLKSVIEAAKRAEVDLPEVINIKEMDSVELRILQENIVAVARAVLDEFREEDDPAIYKILEKNHDQLMRAYDLVETKLKLDQHYQSRADQRPIESGIVAPGQDGGDIARTTARQTRGYGVLGEPGKGEIRTLRPQDSWAKSHSDFSVGKLVRGLVTGDWTNSDAEKRAAQEGTGSTGGYLLPPHAFGPLIDKARNNSVVVGAGAVTMQMDRPEMVMPKVLTDPTGYWRGELEPITESDPTYGRITMKAKTLAALVKVSYELVQDSPLFARTIEQQLAAALALEIDRVALLGTGAASEPRGLFHTPDVNEVSMGANGGSFTDYDYFLDAIQEVEDANGSASAVIMAPRTKTSLAKLKTGLTSDKTTLVPPEEYRNLRRFVTNQIPVTQTQGSSTDCSTAFVGDFSNLVIGVLEGVRIEAFKSGKTSASTYDAAEEMSILIRAHARADIAVLRPTHFTKIIGIRA